MGCGSKGSGCRVPHISPRKQSDLSRVLRMLASQLKGLDATNRILHTGCVRDAPVWSIAPRHLRPVVDTHVEEPDSVPSSIFQLLLSCYKSNFSSTEPRLIPHQPNSPFLNSLERVRSPWASPENNPKLIQNRRRAEPKPANQVLHSKPEAYP